MKIAYLGIPTQNGNFTHYKYLKNGLPDTQFNLIALGRLAADLKLDADDTFINLGTELDQKSSQKQLAFLLKGFLEQNEYDVLLPMNSPIAISIIPFLSKRVSVVQIVNNDTPRVYKYTTSHIPYVSQIICISLKQMGEVKKKVPASFFKTSTHLIPHGIKVSDHQKNLNVSSPLKIGFAGRMEQKHKNIFLIPQILNKLNIAYEFEMIGDGGDKGELLNKLNRYHLVYKDWGLVRNEEVTNIMKAWDVLLFPSFFEGFGLVLIESMNVGVVPVANKLPGVTDFIITDGHDGYVIDKNNPQTFADKIQYLQNNKKELFQMQLAAVNTVKNRFSLPNITREYERVFTEAAKSLKPEPLDLSSWTPYVEYKPSLLQKLLNRLK